MPLGHNSGNDAGAVGLLSKFEKWLDYVSSPDCSAPYGQEPEIDEFREVLRLARLTNPAKPSEAMIEAGATAIQLWWMTQKHEPMLRDNAIDLARTGYLAMTKGGDDVG